MPTIRWPCVKLPDSLVTVLLTMPLPVSVITTLAFGTTEPLESVTLPEMLPYTACPNRAAGADRARTHRQSVNFLIYILSVSNLANEAYVGRTWNHKVEPIQFPTT